MAKPNGIQAQTIQRMEQHNNVHTGTCIAMSIQMVSQLQHASDILLKNLNAFLGQSKFLLVI